MKHIEEKKTHLTTVSTEQVAAPQKTEEKDESQDAGMNAIYLILLDSINLSFAHTTAIVKAQENNCDKQNALILKLGENNTKDVPMSAWQMKTKYAPSKHVIDINGKPKLVPYMKKVGYELKLTDPSKLESVMTYNQAQSALRQDIQGSFTGMSQQSDMYSKVAETALEAESQTQADLKNQMDVLLTVTKKIANKR